MKIDPLNVIGTLRGRKKIAGCGEEKYKLPYTDTYSILLCLKDLSVLQNYEIHYYPLIREYSYILRLEKTNVHCL